MRTHALLLALLASPTLAAAETSKPGAESAESEVGATYFDVAFSGGAMHLGPYEFGGAGARAEVGANLGPMFLALDQALMVFGSGSPGQDGLGLFSRTGASAKFRVGSWLYDGARVSGWLELGVGYQRMPGDEPTKRPDAMVGWMMEIGTPKLGVLLGGRFLAAPERRVDDFVAVAGVEKRNSLDMGVMVSLGVRRGQRERPPSLAAEPDDSEGAFGSEYSLGIRNLRGQPYFTGGIAVRKTLSLGSFSYGAEGSIWLLSLRDRERAVVRDDGLMARVGAVAKLSLWQPELRFMRGDFFVDGGAGYSAGSVTSGRFHALDIQAGGGVGYDITRSDPGSDARRFSAYVATRAVAPMADPSALGWTFGVGLRWLR